MGRFNTWLVFGAVISVFPVTPVSAGPVDLRTWTAESYPAVAGFGAGVWTVSGDGSSVFQRVNGQPTLFHSDSLAHNTQATGTITVLPNAGDDDFIGFVFGFDPGDTGDAGADYLLVDWKADTQDFDFGPPSGDPGGLAPVGLAVSRVSGVPSADEFWQHATYGADGGLVELQRGASLGNAGWVRGTPYQLQFVFLPNRFQLFVDGSKEIDILGSFANGRMGFYNFSQASVSYSAFTVDPRTEPIPEPASVLLMAIGLALVTYRRRIR